MMEYTALRAWVKQRLTYLRWYHLSAWSPDVSLQDFFEAPVVNRKWNTESTDPTLVRFGLLWKVYDWLADKGLDYKVPILDTTPSLNCVKVLGGIDVQAFLLFATEVVQPRAKRGCASKR